MHSLKKIMEEMGFNKDAPIETQKAFLKHLIASAKEVQVKKVPEQQVQLELDLGIIIENSPPKKRVS